MFSKRFSKLTNLLISLQDDHQTNIHRLTALCGEELGAVCALYNRLDGGLLCSIGQWQTPADFPSSDAPEGHICYDVIRENRNEAVLIRNLFSSHYAETDPNVCAYSLQTYFGRAVISEGKTVGSLCAVFQTDYIPSDDDIKIIELIAAAIGHEDARLKSKEALDRSLSLLRKTEAALLEEKAFTENALNILQDVFFVFDLQGRFLRWNRTVGEVTGYSNDEILQMHPLDFFPEQERDKVQSAILRVITEGCASVGATVITRDGRLIPYEYTASLLKTLDGTPIGISGVGRNVSDRRQLEEQLLQAQKMEAVGQLAGGIAHDFNNILSAIMGYASMLQAQAGEDNSLRKYADEILRSAQRAAQLTSSLLAFSRKQHIVLKPVDLNALVHDIHKLLSRIIGEDIELELKLSDGPLPIMADKIQIEHAIINIANNAKDAMPGGGKLTITTTRNMAMKTIASQEPDMPGEYALLAIADTGTGLEGASKEKIFEPFFTTKEVGKGTGLGLSMVYGTIKQHDGHIDVESQPGIGTTFLIYLPISESPVEGDESPRMTPSPAKTASETLLLVEDDDSVRNVMKQILQKAGYSVIEAANGETAINMLKNTRNSVDLLITDIIMPKMDGIVVLQKAREIKPGVRALFISGYHDRILDFQKRNISRDSYLSKPFTTDELLSAIRRALSI